MLFQILPLRVFYFLVRLCLNYVAFYNNLGPHISNFYILHRWLENLQNPKECFIVDQLECMLTNRNTIIENLSKINALWVLLHIEITYTFVTYRALKLN